MALTGNEKDMLMRALLEEADQYIHEAILNPHERLKKLRAARTKLDRAEEIFTT